MKDINKVILVGRLGADPVRRETKSGFTVVSFSVATGRKIKSSDDTEASETEWHQIKSWGKQGESCARYLKKGSSVYLEGSIRTRKFDGKDGKPHTSYEIHTTDVSFLTKSSQKKMESAA